jgi:hypothetical protein
MAPRAKHVEPEYRKPTNKKGPAQEEKPAGPPEEYDTGQPGQGVHPAAVSSEAGTFHSTPVMGGAGLLVGVGLEEGRFVGVPVPVGVPVLVGVGLLLGEAPGLSEAVGEAVPVGVRVAVALGVGVLEAV